MHCTSYKLVYIYMYTDVEAEDKDFSSRDLSFSCYNVIQKHRLGLRVVLVNIRLKEKRD